MNPDALVPLATIVTTDLCAITRGRPVPATDLDRWAATGVGWVPANASITVFGAIADPNPWASSGDLRIRPDLSARYRTVLTGAATPFDMVMGDVVELDGSAWPLFPVRSSRLRSPASGQKPASRRSPASSRNSKSSGIPGRRPTLSCSMRCAAPAPSHRASSLGFTDRPGGRRPPASENDEHHRSSLPAQRSNPAPSCIKRWVASLRSQ